MSNYTKEQIENAKKELLELLNEGDAVWFIIHSVAKSGMSRTMSLHVPVIADNGKPYIRDITWLVARVLDYKVTDKGSWTITVRGGGMNMCFAVAYDLSLVLFGRDCNTLEHRMIS